MSTVDISHIPPLDLPEKFMEDSSSASEEEYNPFMFHTNSDEAYHSFERIFQQFFEVKEKKLMLVSRDKVALIQEALKKLRKWANLIKKEHEASTKQLNAYEELKAKVLQHNQIIINIETAAQIKYDQLWGEFQKIKSDFIGKFAKQSEENELLKKEIEEKDKTLNKLQRSIQMILDQEATLQENNKLLKVELNSIKNELLIIKNVRKFGSIEQVQITQGGKFTAFELVLNSKVKEKIIQYFSLKEISSLLRTSKRLYFALIQPKILIPLALNQFCKSQSKEIKLLQFQLEQYQKLTRECDIDQIKQQMIKVFEFRINATDYITPIFRDIQQLVDGNQFINFKQEFVGMDNLNSFLQQQSLNYYQSLQSLKNSQFPWKTFFPQLEINCDQVLIQRSQLYSKFQGLSQQIFQRLYELSSVCSADISIYSMYLSSLQRCLSNLFVFSQNLAMSFYIMSVFLQVFKDKKKEEEKMEDLKEQINVYADAKQFLNDRLKEIEKRMMENEQRILTLSKENMQKENIISQITKKNKEQQATIISQQEKMKILAKEIVELRKQYKNLGNDYNELVSNFRNLNEALKDLQYAE